MLTTQQLQTIKTYINSVPALAAQPMNADGHQAIADILNQVASPTFIVWRTSISKDEIYANGFNWAAIDDVTEPKWRVWIELFGNQNRSMNPSKANVRAGIAEVWKGNAAKLAVQDYVLSKCKRSATTIEKLLATGAGTDPSPATMNFESPINRDQVEQARLLP